MGKFSNLSLNSQTAIVIISAVLIILVLYKIPAPQLTKEQIVEKQISRQFSEWDGSHINLTKYIKENANDPDSYQHIKTTYRKIGSDSLLVIAKFNVKNAFGGRVSYIVKAKVGLDGEILEILAVQ